MRQCWSARNATATSTPDASRDRPTREERTLESRILQKAYVRFGEGRIEKCQQWQLASRLLYLVMAFEQSDDAKRVLAVLGKRLERYGLRLHPDKTRFVDFRPNRPDRTDHPTTDGTSFDFLGFTHVW